MPTTTAAAPAAAPKKAQNIWNNHPFHYHIAAYLLPVALAIVLAAWLYIYFALNHIAKLGPDQMAEAVAATRVGASWGALLLIAASALATWQIAKRTSMHLDILKRQAAVIRVFDFKTEVALDTPIREIFGLGRAMRQMRDTIQKFMRVTVALSGERDFGKLLGRIIHEMREALDGDGGVIYLYDEKRRVFQVSSQRWGKGGRAQPEADTEISLLDPAHPVAHAVTQLEKTTVHAIGLPRPAGLEYLNARYGDETAYLVVVPLRASDNSLIGIVCNYLAPGKSHPSAERMALAEAFSSVAAVAIDQQRLLEAQKGLLDAMIRLVAGAIDAKSPYTGGHSERVPELALMLAEAAHNASEGPLADFSFQTEDEWREFRIGAWLHDCGKVTTPDYVVDKASKLETLYNRIHEVRMRFEVLLRDARIAQFESLAQGAEPAAAQAAFDARKAQLLDDFAFIAECNLGGEFMAPDRLERLKQIAEQTWLRHFDDRLGLPHEELKRYPDAPEALPVAEKLLADKPQHVIPRTDLRSVDPKWGFKVNVPKNLYNYGEMYNLAIGRGTLTDEERFKINEHVMQSLMMLEQLPLPKNLQRVPEYAGTHHETLAGTGYPRRLSEAELTVPMRIMAIADVFEALTASDRPYKKAKTLSESVKILSFMKKDKHVDPVLFDLFLSSGVYKRYAERFLHPEQIDEVDISKYVSA